MASAQLQEKIDEWLKWDKNPSSRSEIESLVAAKNYHELEKRLLTRMEFGTAGLRARMGAGYSMMNDLTIVQTSQGFYHYLVAQFGLETLQKRGIVLGFDARHNSRKFAHLTARVFVANRVRVYLFRQITPTPFVPYSIVKYKCCAGVMVTASHNPKEDNGYKVYFDNGAQIISPHDKGIAESIERHLEPNAHAWEIEAIEKSELVTDPFDETYAAYYADLKSHLHFSTDEANANSPIKFVYTAMHGVGYEFSVAAFKAFGLAPFIPVKEQIEPDPEFPTVKFPNPEEGKSALDLAIRTANENGATVILANDPDADRFALAEKRADTNEWKIFNGNEIAALIGWWIWHNYKKTKSASSLPDRDVYMLYSTVSSHILRAMAEKEGFSCEDTLTGFKWMGNRAHQLAHEGKRVIFSFEEAIGFMCGTCVLDKDGISAEAVVAEMGVYLQTHEKRSFIDKLDWIYQTYGYHVSNNSYYLCYEQENIQRMFTKLRHYDDNNNTRSSHDENYTYPKTCGPYKINKIRDLTVGIQVDFADNGKTSKPNFPSSKSSQMITFYFENGCLLTLRTSGTEPKIKWYAEMRQLDMNKSRDDVKNELDNLVKHMVDEFYQPEKNNLKPRTT